MMTGPTEAVAKLIKMTGAVSEGGISMIDCDKVIMKELAFDK